MTDLSVRQAAGQAVAQMRAVWPAFGWGDQGAHASAAKTYGEALVSVGDAPAIMRGVTRAIREVGDRFPPPVGELLSYVRAEVQVRPRHVPVNAANRCPVCREVGAELEVVVDANGMASCVEGTHRHVWRAA